jgi:hypothetical protein
LLAVGVVGGIFLATRSRMEARRAEDAMRQAMEEAVHQRQQVEKARMEADQARKAAEKQKAKP